MDTQQVNVALQQITYIPPKDEDIQRAIIHKFFQNLLDVSEWEQRHDIFEYAVTVYLGRYDLWRMYLTELRQKVREHDFDSEDVRDAIATHERAFVFLHKMPQLWLDYTDFLVRNKQITLTRRAFDQALRSLPPTQHHLIWTSYIKFVNSAFIPMETAQRVYRRYLKIEPSQTEQYIEFLLERSQYDEAAQILIDFINDPTKISNMGHTKAQQAVVKKHYQEREQHRSEKLQEKQKEDNIEDGRDEQRSIYSAFNTLGMYKGDWAKGRGVFEQGISTVGTARDFSLVFESYVPADEVLVIALKGQVQPFKRREE
ncbi:MAG: putative XPA binding protein 2 [Streblomastix strix]|uniref:Putative XPA binding protein 2 n=1 Tax=Streblomastix strix TaxID=222440 RepID=A0A5J4WS44_9EUKA|nr:MAG: putative XPA binding protein 2 [Streblomastix strix]